MIELDVKDRKILYHLCLDSRQSFRSLGKKVGLSKDVVAARVKKLQDIGVIECFYTSFNYRSLGLIPLRFYFKYQYISSDKKKAIIDHFVACPYSTVVCSTEGSYDLVVVMLVKQINDMYGFWKDTLMRFGDFFVERIFSVYVEDYIYPYSFLLDNDEDRIKRVHLSRGDMIRCDELDFGILKSLAHDPRISSMDIAEGLGISTSVVGYRIKKLVDGGIINFFSLLIDFTKIGYAGFKVDMFLKEYSRYNEIVKFVERNPSLMSINCTLGYVDLEMELILRDLKELHEFLEEIIQRFPDVIRGYSYFRAIETHKFLLLDLEQL